MKIILTVVLLFAAVILSAQVVPHDYYNPCDFNQDGLVDESDYWAFMFGYETSLQDKNYFAAFDLNDDGYVDIEDFSIFSGCYPLPLGVKDRMALSLMKPVLAVYDSTGRLVGEPLVTGWYIVEFGDKTRQLIYVRE